MLDDDFGCEMNVNKCVQRMILVSKLLVRGVVMDESHLGGIKNH